MESKQSLFYALFYAASKSVLFLQYAIAFRVGAMFVLDGSM